ncbi:MAG: hypothetical protein U5R14_06000 [Gemmatimonadota bacterium]|nr:hypothetical protein [Gemmatimonadota bacterium]
MASGEVGSEHEDPDGWDCSAVSDDLCRYSDAAAILLSVDEDSIGLGKIARTLSRATDDNKGSTTIDSSDPTFEVFGKDSYPSSGQEVNVVGYTGGWRYGDVNQTCATYHPRGKGDDYLGNENDIFVVCGYRAEFHSWGGDSGSPVFIISPQGNGVYITGLNFGNEGCILECEHAQALFAPMGGIDADFVGDIGVTTAALQPHASITGPTTAAMWTYCTYDAHASGGTPPYSYQWSGLASGTGSSISFTVTQSGTLYLQVTDANLETDDAQISLTVDSSSESCPL